MICLGAFIFLSNIPILCPPALQTQQCHFCVSKFTWSFFLWWLQKVQKVLEFINNNSFIDDVYDINIEDNLSGFAGGRTSQQVIIKLAKFNAILCFMLENFDFKVHSINPMTARKNVFGKARVKGLKAKDFVKQEIEKMYNTSKWCKKLHEEIGIKEISICMMDWLCHFLKKKLDLLTKNFVYCINA